MIAQIEQKDSKPIETTFNHSQLGDIIGWERGNDIVQFRGIPYADIPGRFRQSVLKEELPQQPFNAKNGGPTCPHPPQQYWEYWKAELPVDLPILQPTVTDEFKCLNLSITIPSHVVRGEKKVPVFVFIHGGAFVGGSHAIQLHGREVFDPAGLVRHSVRLGKDMIAVGINYRVGPLGFLASKEMTAFSKSHGEFAGNYGLHDQRQALEWLHKFVSGFGGDPDRITIQGTSAGGASCHFLTLFPERKFQRAILASGTCWGIGAVPEDIAQKTFDRIYSATKQQQTKPFQVLQDLDVDTLNNIVPYAVCNPLIENRWVSQNALLPPDIDRVQPAEIMVGAALREDDIGEVLLRDMKTWEFRTDANAWNFMSSVFASNGCVARPSEFPFENSKLIEEYSLGELQPFDPHNPKLDLPTHGRDWATLLGHVAFNFPSYFLAERLSQSKEASKVWLFNYEAKNPYPASHSRDMAHHGVNDLLLFNVAPDRIPEENLEDWIGAVEQTQRSWIEFVNGESPWSPVEPKDRLGPVFIFRDGRGSAEVQDIREGAWTKMADQWDAMRPSCYH